MTITQARNALKARRLNKSWSFDSLYADMVRVIGDRAPSPPTIRRFVIRETAPEETTTHVICEYLQKVEIEESPLPATDDQAALLGESSAEGITR